MYGLTLVPEPMAAASILLGALLLGGFLWWEVQCKSPLLDMSVFHRNLAFAFSNIAALINYAATYAVAFLLSLYLQYTRGLAPEAAGMILVAQPLVQMIFSPSAGRLSDRIEPRIVASAGMSLTAIGLLFFVFLSEETPLWLIVGVLLVLGLGYALFSSPNTNAIMSSVAPRHYGVASSMVATMRATGQLASIAIAMMVFSLFMGRVQVTPEVYPLFLTSVQVAFLILGVLCLIGVFASYARGRIREAVEEPVGRRQPSVR
jgi:MFS family permease